MIVILILKCVFCLSNALPIVFVWGNSKLFRFTRFVPPYFNWPSFLPSTFCQVPLEHSLCAFKSFHYINYSCFTYHTPISFPISPRYAVYSIPRFFALGIVFRIPKFHVHTLLLAKHCDQKYVMNFFLMFEICNERESFIIIWTIIMRHEWIYILYLTLKFI